MKTNKHFEALELVSVLEKMCIRDRSCAARDTASPPTPSPVNRPFMLYPSSDITITIAMHMSLIHIYLPFTIRSFPIDITPSLLVFLLACAQKT